MTAGALKAVGGIDTSATIADRVRTQHTEISAVNPVNITRASCAAGGIGAGTAARIKSTTALADASAAIEHESSRALDTSEPISTDVTVDYANTALMVLIVGAIRAVAEAEGEPLDLIGKR